jgi:hypothetical protein
MIKLTDYERLEEGLKNLNREEARQYYNAYKQWGTSQKHPIDAIFDLIENQVETSYKIVIRNMQNHTQTRKKVYESYKKFLKYGPDICKRFHNVTFYNGNLTTYCECYKMQSGKWVKIPSPEEFKIKDLINPKEIGKQNAK